MQTEAREVVTPRPHPGQREVLDTASRFTVVSCGRRWGKTLLGTRQAARAATLHGQPVAWASPTYKMMLEVWRSMRDTLRPVTERASVSERRLELITGGRVEFWSLDNPDAMRGRQYGLIIVDEAAMVPDLVGVWNAVLRPTLIDRAGAAWFLSTPRGRNGFWRIYQWGEDPARTEWASAHQPTSSNPYIPPAEIQAARESMPEAIYRQEIEAEFLEAEGAVFRRVLDAVGEVDTEPDHSRRYVFGVDWGKHNDFTVITVVDVETRQVVALDRFNQIDYRVQTDRLRALAERYQPDAIIAERNSMGEPLIETLYHEGLPVVPFTTTNATKAAAVEALALAFERGEITIPDEPTLVAELQAFEASRLPSGLMRYEAPAGMHDDCVLSLAMAWSGVASAPSGRLFV